MNPTHTHLKNILLSLSPNFPTLLPNLAPLTLVFLPSSLNFQTFCFGPELDRSSWRFPACTRDPQVTSMANPKWDKFWFYEKGTNGQHHVSFLNVRGSLIDSLDVGQVFGRRALFTLWVGPEQFWSETIGAFSVRVCPSGKDDHGGQTASDGVREESE